MGLLVSFMCFLATPVHAIDYTIKTRLLLRPIVSELGVIRLAGINKGGFGAGMPPGPMRTLKCYAFNYTLSGRGTYRDRRCTTPVEKGDMVFFFPDIPHGCGTAKGEYWDELWFEFEGPIFDLMKKVGLLDPRHPIRRTDDCDYWFRRFFQIIPPIHLRKHTPAQVIVGQFAAILIELLAGSKGPEEKPAVKDDWINQACELLSHHDGPDCEPAVVARKLGLSYESFRKKFSKSVGFSPGRFHLDARIDRAAALLHQGRHQIREIAEQLNFCDEFYFSRCFKRRFGQSPREFRRRVRGG